MIKVHALVFGAKLKSKAERFAVSGREHLLAFDFLAGFIGDDGDDRFARESDSANVGPDDRGSRLEIGLADRNLADAHILGHAA